MIHILRHGTISIYPKVCNILYGIKISKLSHITIPEYHYTPSLDCQYSRHMIEDTAIDICDSSCLPVIQSWFGEWFDSVWSGRSFHMVMNFAKLLLMWGWRQSEGKRDELHYQDLLFQCLPGNWRDDKRAQCNQWTCLSTNVRFSDYGHFFQQYSSLWMVLTQ